MTPTTITAIEPAQLLLLLNWMSPAFPIGAFAYSHGLEWAIEEGLVQDAESLFSWVEDLMQQGSLWNDAVLFANCARHDGASLNELALALCPSQERWLETTQLGQAFAVAASTWSGVALPPAPLAYPVAAGLACASMAVPARHALLAFLQGAGAALVSVAVRLVPLGQTQGLAVLKRLAPVIAAVAARAENATLDELGSSCLVADMAAMHHALMEGRVFRT